MNKKRYILTLLFLGGLSVLLNTPLSEAAAQTNGCNSSYSRFGLGLLSDQAQGFNRGMGGVAQGFRDGKIVNMQNPASYSAIDSLSFILDAGMGLQVGRMKGNGQSISAMNTTLEYVNAGFRLTKGLGMSFGFVPYSTIGYNFSDTKRVGSSYTSSQSITTATTYYGNGGLHELYIGMGWIPFHRFSIGANIAYVWGDYNHSLSQSFYEGGSTSSAYNTQNAAWSSDMKTYKLDIGLQYPIRINPKNELTLGATVGIGHHIGSDVTLMRYTSEGDTLQKTLSKAFDMPYTISAGASWKIEDRITIGADYQMERWSGCKVPVSQTTSSSMDVTASTNEYSNRHRIALGADYMTKPTMNRRYGERIHYRLGASFTTPYVKVNGHDGPKEFSMSAGVALPLTTAAASKSLINVSLQWLKRSPSVSNQITENYFIVNLGITFNERWFEKFRFN